MSVFRFSLFLALVSLTSTAFGSSISASRGDVFAADVSFVNGDTTTEGIVDGEYWSFDYVSASNFAVDGTTSLSPLSATTLFGATSTNVLGDYHSGFGGVNPYFTHGEANGTVIGTRLVGVSGGHSSLSVDGVIDPWTSTTVTGSTINVDWKLVEYDLFSNSFTTLDSGSITGTSNGSLNNIMTLAGDTTVSGSASLALGDWVGMFYQKTGSSALFTGSHFNINDDSIVYSFPVPAPAGSLLIVAAVLLFARRR